MFEKYLLVFVISMVPLIELRGAIPIAILLGLHPFPAALVCAAGNLTPVPVIYLFARKFLLWGLNKPLVGPICRFFTEKAQKTCQKLENSKFGHYGLMAALTAFVGIPLPGTGAWTGTLGASFLGMGKKATVTAVTLGVTLAACIMSTVSLLGVHVFGL